MLICINYYFNNDKIQIIFFYVIIKLFKSIKTQFIKHKMDDYYSDTSFESKNNRYRKFQDQNRNTRNTKYRQELHDVDLNEMYLIT
jgi:hypothetical protein